MNADMSHALQISLIGMSLVFGAIVFLWGIMVLLRQLPSPTQTLPGHEKDDTGQDNLKYRAAAVAVALALSEKAAQNEGHRFPLPPTAIVSAWQAVMRSTQLQRRRPR